MMLYLARRYEEAIAQLEKTIDLSPAALHRITKEREPSDS